MSRWLRGSWNKTSLGQASLPSNKKNIIAIVDDDKDLLDLYSEYLTFNGFKTITFEHPEHLLEYIQTNSTPFSLIITDYRMPKIDGIDLIKNIRKFDNYTNGKTKFILLSAFIKEDLVYKNQVLDGKLIDKILEKPLSLVQLKTAIIEALNNL